MNFFFPILPSTTFSGPFCLVEQNLRSRKYSVKPRKSKLVSQLKSEFRGQYQNLMFTLHQELDWLIEPEIRKFCGPLFFARSLETGGENITANGSFGLIDTGKRKILVTCCHVWENFLTAQHKEPLLRMCVCLDANSPIVLNNSQLLDANQSLDVATFDMASLLPACGGREFYRLDRSPPSSVKKGDHLVFLGYPGRFRSSAPEEVEFGRILYAVIAADVGHSSFVADISNVRSRFNKEPICGGADPHGGVSGSPCFLIRENRALRLVGFVTSDGLGLLKFTHARFIDPNGAIASY